MAYKQNPKSPIAKALVGNQHKLPRPLQDAIKAAPESPAKQTTGHDPNYSPSLGDVAKGVMNLVLPGSGMLYDRLTDGGKKEPKKGEKLKGSGKGKMTKEVTKKPLGIKDKKKVDETENYFKKRKEVKPMPEPKVEGLKPKKPQIDVKAPNLEVKKPSAPAKPKAPKSKKQKRKETAAAYLELGAQRLKNKAKKLKE